MTRFLIACGTAKYEDDEDALPAVPAELAQIRDLFVEQLGYVEALANLRLNPATDDLRRGLEAWLGDAKRSPDDVVVLYYTGHGFTEGGVHYLETASTRAGHITTAIETDLFIRLLGPRGRVRRVLIVLDVCFAAGGARDLVAFSQRLSAYQDQQPFDRGEGVWVIAAARAKEAAKQSAFSTAFTEAVRQLGAVTPASQKYLSFDVLFDLVNGWFEDNGLAQRAGFTPADFALGLPPFLPNPSYAEDDPTAVLYAKAPEIADLAAHAAQVFVGRKSALRALAAPVGVVQARVVVGRPGSGKSALLAEFVELVRGVATSPIPRVVGIDARDKTEADLVADMGLAMGLHGAELSDLIRAAPKTIIVIDSLDESAEPDAIAQGLLPLLTSSRGTAALLVFGCRTASLPVLPFEHELIDLDSPEFLVTKDVAEFVLGSLLGSRWFAQRPGLAQQIAATVAERVDGSFVRAGLVTSALKTVEQATVQQLESIVDASIASAFEADLRRFGQDARRVRDLLTPLAWARGAGLPWETIWVPLANALTNDERVYTDEDVRWLLEFGQTYLLQTQDLGRTVFRVYHDALAEHLRTRHDTATAERRIVSTILNQLRRDESGRPLWPTAHDYVRRHLAEHAVTAGCIDDLIVDAGFLAVADLDRLLPLLGAAISPRATAAAEVYTIASESLRTARGSERAAILGLTSFRQGNAALAMSANRLAGEGLWRARWADWEPSDLHRTVTRMPAAIGAIAAQVFDGRPLVAVGDRSGAVRVVDTLTSESVLEWQGSKSIDILAWLDLGDGLRLVAGDGDGHVHIWRTLDSPTPTSFHAHARYVRSLAAGVVDDRAVLVSGATRGDDRGVIRVWDVSTLDPISAEFEAFPGSVLSLRVRRDSGGRATILAAGDRIYERINAPGQIRSFDPVSGTRVADIEVGDASIVALIDVDDHAVISTERGLERWDLAGPVLAASYPTDRVLPPAALLETSDGLRVAMASWRGVEFLDVNDLTPDRARGPLRQDNLTTIASISMLGHESVIAGDDKGVVRAWDPRSGTAHAGTKKRGIRTLAVTSDALVSVDLVGQLELRDPLSGQIRMQTDSAPWFRHIATCAARGKDLIFVTTAAGEVAAMSPTSGAHVVAGPVGEITSLTAAVIDQDVLIATSSELSGRRKGTQIWNADTGESVGPTHIESGYSDKAIYASIFARLPTGDAVICAGAARSHVHAWHVEAARRWQPQHFADCPNSVELPAPHDDYVRAFALAPEGTLGTLLSVGDDGQLAALDLATNRFTFRLEHAHKDWIYSVSCGKVAGRTVMATGSRDGSLKLWGFGDEPELLIEISLDATILSTAICGSAVYVATDKGVAALDISRSTG